MKRIISLILVSCFLCMTLVACGGGKESSKGTGKPTETQKQTDIYGQEAITPITDWSTLDFEGEELNVLVRNDEKVSREWEREDVGDDELDLAIANRNEVVEGNLGVNVEITLVGGSEWNEWFDSFSPIIIQDVDNGLHSVDIVANFGYSGMRSGLRDYYVNLLDKDTFPYFNFGLNCWNQAMVNNGTVNGRLFICTGDMNLSLFDAAMIMWHNKDLYEKLREDDDPKDIQDTIMAGDWTFAELYKWASYYVPASTGSGDCSDIYGTYIQGEPYPTQPNDAIVHAWQLSFINTEADGTHSFNLVGNTKAEQALTDFRTLYSAGGNFWENRDTCTCGTGGHFVSGGVLFKGDVLFWDKAGNNAIREMEDTYSIAPWPKYDETQTNYATTSQDYFTGMSVLDHAKSSVPTKGEAVSAYLQYATEYSYTHVRGYYFERIIKPKFFGTDDSDGHVTKSVSIFVTIIDNLQFDFATIYGQMIESVVSNVWRYTVHGGGSIESKYNSNKQAYDDALHELDIWFELIEK